MNNCRHLRGFSLVEVLASCVVLSVAAIGITAVWRLADSKALLARLDHRAERVLREYYELQIFAPKSAKPLTDAILPAGYAPRDPLNGFLYHPLKSNRPPNDPQYEDRIPYSISPSLEGGTLTLTYTVAGYSNEAAQTFTKTVILNPLPTP
jgi:type II secretory pathway pseudopilin PulG